MVLDGGIATASDAGPLGSPVAPDAGFAGSSGGCSVGTGEGAGTAWAGWIVGALVVLGRRKRKKTPM
jgi:MYXO-CTERM domain-containing protein